MFAFLTNPLPHSLKSCTAAQDVRGRSKVDDFQYVLQGAILEVK